VAGTVVSCEVCTTLPGKCAKCDGTKCIECAANSNLYPPCLLPGDGKTLASEGRFYV
jgi:hypothetical protein